MTAALLGLDCRRVNESLMNAEEKKNHQEAECLPGYCGVEKAEKGLASAERGKQALLLFQKISVPYISLL